MTAPAGTSWDRVVNVARTIRPAPAAVRLVVLLAGVVLVVVPSPWTAPGLAFAGAGAVLAAALPAQVGASLLTVGFLLAWLGAYGLHGDPGIWRTVVAAAALFVAHQGCALAAVVPLDARVDPGVLVGWSTRCIPPVLVAGGAAAVDLLLPRRGGTPLAEVLGLVAAVGVVVVGLWWGLAPAAGAAGLPGWLPLPRAVRSRIDRVGSRPDSGIRRSPASRTTVDGRPGSGR